MRWIGFALAAIFAFAIPCLAADSPPTLTRAEIAKLTPRQLSTRILSMLGMQTTAAEVRTYISPVAPTPPWLYRAEVDMPPAYDADLKLCHIERLGVDFEPADPQAAQTHMFDANYDVPVHISQIDMMHEFADPGANTDCAAIAKDSYFTAADSSTAVQALDAFHAFRAAAMAGKSATNFVCEDFAKTGGCAKGAAVAQAIQTFDSVISLQEERHADASITRTIVLSVGTPDTSSKEELWLTYRFAKTNGLAKADLKILWPDPIP